MSDAERHFVAAVCWQAGCVHCHRPHEQRLSCVAASDYDALAAENARLREALEWINQLEYMRDTDGSLGPKPPYSWESVARLAFDYAFDALHRAVQPSVSPTGDIRCLSPMEDKPTLGRKADETAHHPMTCTCNRCMLG